LQKAEFERNVSRKPHAGGIESGASTRPRRRQAGKAQRVRSCHVSLPSYLTFAVILAQQHHAAWLGKTEDGNLKALLVPYPADQMQMWEISPQVNSPMTIHYFGQVSHNCLFVFFRAARSEINCFLESRHNRRLSKIQIIPFLSPNVHVNDVAFL
jgi:hypothetical protein